jgi:oxygen-dependent protoporphyrinogen oxidase
MTKSRTAIIGGGISGLTAAWQLSLLGGVEATVYEATAEIGGIVSTALHDGFVIERGPDGWVTEKPWASEFARELGLGDELIVSNDAGRVTYILLDGQLTAMPQAMRMMVPTDLTALDASPLFSAEAKQAYAAELTRSEELKTTSPSVDESIAAFVLRHFGPEVLRKIAAPLLTGVFGGDVSILSVRAVMPAFVAMERERGSLIAALQSRSRSTPPQPVFTSLRNGVGALIDRMIAAIPAHWIRRHTAVTGIARSGSKWLVQTASGTEQYDAVFLAVPSHIAAELLRPIDPHMTALSTMEASSAVVAAFAFTEHFDLPQGFGFLVPEGEASLLMAATFIDQKFPHRVPPGGRALRAFFGGASAARLAPLADEQIAQIALDELRKILGPLPPPAFSVVRRMPLSLPQYAVGHLDRMAELAGLVRNYPGLWLLGNPYHGVGLPDLIRTARQAARESQATCGCP